jgi:hypothetical protein
MYKNRYAGTNEYLMIELAFFQLKELFAFECNHSDDIMVRYKLQM